MRIHLLCIHKRTSCVYTRDLLCMHNTLVHALGHGTQGPGTQKGSGPGPGTRDPIRQRSRAWDRPSVLLGSMDAQECCACTRDLLCIHKRFSCVYTRDLLCRHKNLLCRHNRYLVFTQHSLTAF